MRGFWPVESAELADGPIGCGTGARGGGCFVAWNFRVTRSVVLREAESRH